MPRRRSVLTIPPNLSCHDTPRGTQLPTADEAAKAAYELLTSPSAEAAGVLRAPSGRRVRKHVCLHPGCGKAFHLRGSATAHQEKDHRFRQRLGEFGDLPISGTCVGLGSRREGDIEVGRLVRSGCMRYSVRFCCSSNSQRNIQHCSCFSLSAYKYRCMNSEGNRSR